MRVMGFNFDKISIERFLDNITDMKISTNIDISDIIKLNPGILKTKEEILGVKFNYIIDYQENIAKIELAGKILLALEPKQAKEVLKQWDDKKVPDEFRITLFNFIFRKANIKAIQLEDEMNLPIHIPLPKIGKSQDK